MRDLTIGKLAQIAGVNVETVRFYERKALLEQPARPKQGFRIYPEDAVDRIRFIRQAQELGFSLSDVMELLDLRMAADGDCADVRLKAADKLAEVRQKLERLRRIEEALVHLITACPGEGALECCTIIEAMEAKRIDGMRTIRWTIEGMACDTCAERLRGALLRAQGVRTANVSYKTRSAEITFNETALSADRLRRVVERTGFTVAEE